MVFHFFVNLIFQSLFPFSLLRWYNYAYAHLLLIKYSCLCYVYVIVLHFLNKFLCSSKQKSSNCRLYSCYVFFSLNRCCRQLVHCPFSHLNYGKRYIYIYVGWPLSKHKKEEREREKKFEYTFSLSLVHMWSNWWRMSA